MSAGNSAAGGVIRRRPPNAASAGARDDMGTDARYPFDASKRAPALSCVRTPEIIAREGTALERVR